MPKPNTSPHTPIRWQYLHAIRKYWIWGLAFLLSINALAIGYIVITANQQNDVHITQENADAISTLDPIVIRFNMPMVQSTVANALQITPSHQYQLVWADDSQQLSIIPETPWSDNTRYTIRVTTDAQSQIGIRINEPWYGQIYPQRVVQIRQVLPSPNQTDVARDGMIVVRFGQQMVVQARVGMTLNQSPLQIFPPTNGVSKWLDVRTLAFQADELAPNQEYTVTVPAQVHDVNDAPLQSSYTWRFRTMATRIEQSVPADNSQEVNLQQSIALTMTGQIDQVRLAQTLVITPTTAHQLRITTLDNRHTRIEIMPQTAWQSDTQYQVAVGGGDSTLAPFHTTFRTISALRLVARTPGDGEIVGRDREVRFIFNTLLDTRTITEAITITPEPIQPARITTTGRDIRITANWEVQVNPIIQISSALRNTNGITLTNPISSELRIDQRQALVRLPGIPSEIYDASTTKTFQLQVIPNRAVTLRIYDMPIATLVRMLDMDITPFLNIDPERYNLPLLSQQTIQNNDGSQRITVDLMRDINTMPQSRIWLVQLISANGSQDIRLVRAYPATLHAVSLPQHVAAGIYADQQPQPDRTILLFQSGQLIGQGISNNRGIWQTSLYSSEQQYIIVDPQVPFDAYKLTTRVPTSTAEIQLVVDRHYVAQGSQISAIIARQHRGVSETAALRIRRDSGELLTEQQLIIDANIQILTTQIRLPNKLSPGIYHIEVVIANNTTHQTLLVYDNPIQSTTITYTPNQGNYDVVALDEYGQFVRNQPVYWRTDQSSGQSITDARGMVSIPQMPYDTILMVQTTNGSMSQVIPAMTQQARLDIIQTQNWVESNQPITLRMQLSGPPETITQRIIQITAQNEEYGQRITPVNVVTDTDGVATTQLTLPYGNWRINATSNELVATTNVWVGMTYTNSFEPEYNTLSLGQTPRWIHNQSAAEPLLVAQSVPQQITVDWGQTDTAGIIQTTPISQTGTLYTAIGQAGKPYFYGVQTIVDPQCRDQITPSIMAQNQQLSLQLQYMPNSRIFFHMYDYANQRIIAESERISTDENGLATWQIPDNGVSTSVYISAIADTNSCQAVLSQYERIDRIQTLRIDAPPIVRIGDIITVTAFIHDKLPAQASQFRVTLTGLQIIDTLPEFNAISDQNGDAQLAWRYRVTADQVQLAVESQHVPIVRWTPIVSKAPITYSNDGFAFSGTTSVEKGNDTPVLLDIIATPQQLQQALNKTPYDQRNPSHVAHRLWHSVSPTDQLILMQQLTQLKLPNGAWGWVGSQTADPLITADVIIALTNAQQPMVMHQGALQYLQQQFQNPQFSPTVRALVGYALALNQLLPPTDILTLSNTPHLLGNEGLAAVLLSIPNELAYRIPPVLTELLQRSQTAPRGLWWADDSATKSLHNRENVNALIYQALATLNVAPNERSQLGAQLLSMRGVNGWANSISNARIWAQHQYLLPAFMPNNTITIRNGSSQIIHTGVMSPAQPVIQNSQIQSSNPVVVGIARPRNAPAPTGEAAIWLQMYRKDGTRVEDQAMLHYGEEITVNISIAFFSVIPHITVIAPQSTLSAPIPQINTTPLSIQVLPHAILLHAQIETPQVLQYRYRIRMNHLGRSQLEPIEIRDGSETIHAQSQPVMLYVVAP